MKDTIRLIGALCLKLSVIVLVAAVGFGLAACDNGTTNNGGGEEVKELSLKSVEAAEGTPTTQLILKFSGAVTGLTKDNIAISPGVSPAGKATVTSVSDGGDIWTVGINTTQSGNIFVRVTGEVSGYRVTGNRQVKVAAADAALGKIGLTSAVSNTDGKTATTTALILTFDKDYGALSSGNILISPYTVAKGAVKNTGTGQYTINISNFGSVVGTDGKGSLEVSVQKQGYNTSDTVTAEVYIYKKTIDPTVTTVGFDAKNEFPTTVTTKYIILKFDRAIPGLTRDNFIISSEADISQLIKGELGQVEFKNSDADYKYWYPLWIYGTFPYGTNLKIELVKDGYGTETDPIVMIYCLNNPIFLLDTDAEFDSDGKLKKDSGKLIINFGIDVGGMEVGLNIKMTGQDRAVLQTGTFTYGQDPDYAGKYVIGISGLLSTETVSIQVEKEGFSFVKAVGAPPELNPTKTVTLYYRIPELSDLDALRSYMKSAAEAQEEIVSIRWVGTLPTGGLADINTALGLAPDTQVILDLSAAGVEGAIPIDTSFQDNTQLVEVILGKATTIAGNAFSGCTNLEKLNIKGTLPANAISAGTSIFGDVLVTLLIDAPQPNKIFGTTNIDYGELIDFGESLNGIISDNMFNGYVGLSSIKLDGITVIGDSAFAGCTGLVGIDIPNTVTEVRASAFSGCNNSDFTEVVIPNSVVTLGENVFDSCTNLATVSIGTGVRAIPKEAFNGCTALLSGVTLPANVKEIGESAFAGCVKLNELTVNGALEIVGDSAFPTALISGVFTLALGDTPKYADLDLPIGSSDKIKLLGNASIATGNFPEMQPINLIMDGTSAAALAALGSALTSVELGEHFAPTTLTGESFNANTALATISVAANNKVYAAIDSDSILTSYDKKTLIRFPLGKSLAGLSLETLFTSPSLVTIGESAFEGCSNYTDFPTVVIPATVKTIGAKAFASCDSLESITIKGALSSLGAGALPEECVEVTLGGTPLPAVAFPATVSKLSLTGAANPVKANFGDGEGITELTLGGSAAPVAQFQKITTLIIGEEFSGEITADNITGLSELSSITGSADDPNLAGNRYFESGGALVKETTTPGSGGGAATVSAVLIKYPPKGSAASVEIDTDLVDEIGTSAFSGSLITGVTFTPGSTPKLKIIGANAFEGCESLTSITIPNTVTAINDYAFNRAGLTGSGLTLGTGLLTIGARAFAGTAITEVTFPTSSNFASIGANAFSGTPLTEVTFQGGKMAVGTTPGLTIGASAFADCENLKTLDLNGVDVIGASAFSGSGIIDATDGLTSVVISAEVSSIGANAFNGCIYLAELDLSGAVALKTIGDSAFVSTAIESIAPKGANTLTLTIGKDAFKGVETLTNLDESSTLYTGIIVSSGAFSGCTALNVPNLDDLNVTSIGAGAFEGIATTGTITTDTLSIGSTSSVTSIGTGAFDGAGITEITLEKAVSIPANAFANLTALEKLTINAKPSVSPSAFSGSGKDGSLAVVLVIDVEGLVASLPVDVINDLTIQATQKGNFSTYTALEKLTVDAGTTVAISRNYGFDVLTQPFEVEFKGGGQHSITSKSFGSNVRKVTISEVYDETSTPKKGIRIGYEDSFAFVSGADVAGGLKTAYQDTASTATWPVTFNYTPATIVDGTVTSQGKWQ